MYREGHVGAALLLYAPLGFVSALLGEFTLAFYGVLASAGIALLPDVDRYLPLGHRRGVTHTVWFSLDVGIVLAGFGGARASDAGVLAVVAGALFGFYVGAGAIASHVIVDAFTPGGVQPIWPLDERTYAYDVGLASDRITNYALLVLGIGVAAMALWLGLTVAG